MTDKKLTLEQARDILNKSYKVPEDDYFCIPGKWYIKYNRNNNSESDRHPLEERFLCYSGNIPEILAYGGYGDLIIGNGNRLFWENDILNMTEKEFVKLCNKEFATIVSGSERNKLYKEYIEKCIEEENRRKQDKQKSFFINKRKEKIFDIIADISFIIIVGIVLYVLTLM